MYICVLEVLVFLFFTVFPVGFWNCSDSEVFLVFIVLQTLMVEYRLNVVSLKYYYIKIILSFLKNNLKLII